MRTHFIEWAATLRRKGGDGSRSSGGSGSYGDGENASGRDGGGGGRGDAAVGGGKPQPELDVARQPRVKMADHAGYKYLLHLDGQSCSSR